jgi:copper(I)-binding protein
MCPAAPLLQLAPAFLVAVMWPGAAAAHGYRIGALEITHPAIVEPHPGMNCTCAYLRIRNLGTATEYFLGAHVAAGRDTMLLSVNQSRRNTGTEKKIAIAPGETIDLRHGWCLFISGLTERLEADLNVIAGELLFESAGTIAIEFMIDPRRH